MNFDDLYRDNDIAPTKGKELDLAAPESNYTVLFLITRSGTLCAFAASGETIPFKGYSRTIILFGARSFAYISDISFVLCVASRSDRCSIN